MATYMMLGNFTEKGLSHMEETPDRIKKFKDICQEEGAKVLSYYMLMGQYDVACLLEAPNPEVIAKIALIIGKRGNAHTETFCAFNEADMVKLTQQIH